MFFEALWSRIQEATYPVQKSIYFEGTKVYTFGI